MSVLSTSKVPQTWNESWRWVAHLMQILGYCKYLPFVVPSWLRLPRIWVVQCPVIVQRGWISFFCAASWIPIRQLFVSGFNRVYSDKLKLAKSKAVQSRNTLSHLRKLPLLFSVAKWAIKVFHKRSVRRVFMEMAWGRLGALLNSRSFAKQAWNNEVKYGVRTLLIARRPLSRGLAKSGSNRGSFGVFSTLN